MDGKYDDVPVQGPVGVEGRRREKMPDTACRRDGADSYACNESQVWGLTEFTA